MTTVCLMPYFTVIISISTLFTGLKFPDPSGGGYSAAQRAAVVSFLAGVFNLLLLLLKRVTRRPSGRRGLGAGSRTRLG